MTQTTPRFRDTYRAAYDWPAIWAAIPRPGDVLVLKRGEDFSPVVEHFRKALAQRARTEDPPVYVRTEIVPGPERNELRVTRLGHPPRGKGKGDGYRWDLWFDGEKHALYPDLDFRVPADVMVNNVRAAATRRGTKVRINTTFQPGVIWVQALPSGDET